MVTAKSSEIDTVVGLEVGADDYVTKPYRLRELVARMRAVLRRSPSADNGEPAGEVLEVGGLRLDPARHEVHLNGDQVPLPLKEFELLELLMGNAGRVLTRETLIDRIWGPHYVGDTKTLDVHVKRLRAKIEDDPARPARITTIRGLGYKFEALPGPSGGAGRVSGPAVAAAIPGYLMPAGRTGPAGQPSGRSMRASHRPGASSSAGVGSSRSDRHSRSRPSVPARSTMPRTNAWPRS